MGNIKKLKIKGSQERTIPNGDIRVSNQNIKETAEREFMINAIERIVSDREFSPSVDIKAEM